MKISRVCTPTSLLFSTVLLLLAACSGETETGAPNPATAGAGVDDAGIQARVESALVNASDLPGDFTVSVADGIVSITGSVQCEDCGGRRTPGHLGTVQQSLGAVVRAVPGVREVQFSLDYGPEYPAAAQPGR